MKPLLKAQMVPKGKKALVARRSLPASN